MMARSLLGEGGQSNVMKDPDRGTASIKVKGGAGEAGWRARWRTQTVGHAGGVVDTGKSWEAGPSERCLGASIYEKKKKTEVNDLFDFVFGPTVKELTLL